MRAWIALLVVASGCDALIGIEDPHLLPDAAHPDATPDGPLPQANAPALTPDPGAGTPCRTVTITNSTPNGFIHVATDGSTATTASPLYTGPIQVQQTMTISAMVEAVGYRDSDAAGGLYIIMPGAIPPPTMSPASGYQDNDVNVTLGSAAMHQATCYTLDNSTPSCGSGYCGADRVCDPSSQTYQGVPFSLTTGGTVHVRAITCTTLSDTGSSESSAIISFKVGTPVLTPSSGTTSSVTISTSTSGAVRCYRIDGTDPGCSGGACDGASATYSGSAISIAAPTTIKAIACKATYSDSNVVTGTYSP
jgi:hypothetical protein